LALKMKISRGVLMIVLSVVAGLGAVILAASWMGKQSSDKSTPLVIAALDIDSGVPLTEAMLKVVAWPSAALPPNAFKDLKSLTGRVVRAPLFKGEPILEPKLAPQGSMGGLPAAIQHGKRALSIKVNEVVGVAGFTLPGSYVDVMVNTLDTKDKSVSKIVLQRIHVLAIAQEAKRDDAKPKVVNAVTLEVTPEEAEKLDLARSIGSLSLILRNPLDKLDQGTTGSRREDLLGKEAVPAAIQKAEPMAPPEVVHSPPVPRRPAARVELIRGTQKANADF
jgi:pilus assembly protein CpaB